MKRFSVILAFSAALIAAQPVIAADTSVDAMNAALSGQYDEAVDMATELKTSDGYTVAASAIVAKILTLNSDDIKDDAKDARDFAKEALELEPDNAEALLQYAVAYGIVTRASSDFTAWRKKMPQKTRAAIEAARVASPDDARVDALLGSWHTGVVRKAGAKRGADMFGADAAAGIAAFEQAALRAPTDIVINMNYALSALALDPVQYGPRGKELLQISAAQTAQSDIDRVYQGWATELLTIFDDTETMQARATYFVDGE